MDLHDGAILLDGGIQITVLDENHKAHEVKYEKVTYIEPLGNDVVNYCITKDKTKVLILKHPI